MRDRYMRIHFTTVFTVLGRAKVLIPASHGYPTCRDNSNDDGDDDDDYGDGGGGNDDDEMMIMHEIKTHRFSVFAQGSRQM